MKRTVWILTAILLLTALAALAWWRGERAEVERLSLRTGPIVESIYGLGTVRAARDFELKLAVPGRIEELPVREGESVGKGAPLMRLDSTGWFRAPFAGTVVSLPFHESDTVFAQQPALKLADLNERYVEVSVEQRGALRIRAGQPARLVFESIRSERFEGQVESLYPRDGEFIARIRADGLPPQVLPGMTADVAIEVARQENARLIPVGAVQQGSVLRERQGRRERVKVRLGAIDGNWAELLEGDLGPEDAVLVRRPARKP
jgi:macrolide-specific efflux system membrane fusion protein